MNSYEQITLGKHLLSYNPYFFVFYYSLQACDWNIYKNTLTIHYHAETNLMNKLHL